MISQNLYTNLKRIQTNSFTSTFQCFPRNMSTCHYYKKNNKITSKNETVQKNTVLIFLQTVISKKIPLRKTKTQLRNFLRFYLIFFFLEEKLFLKGFEIEILSRLICNLSFWVIDMWRQETYGIQGILKTLI